MRKYRRITVSMNVLEVVSMDRGENRIPINLPNEAMLPLTDWQHDNKLGSKRQAAVQIVIIYLHDHGYLTDENLASIKERTHVFRTDKEFLEQKLAQFREKITEREITEIYIPRQDLKHLKRINNVIQTLPLEKWERFKPGYMNKAKEYLPHPLAKRIIEILKKQ